ncbi:MAG: hypothetical protein RLZZ223_337 [Candidatus Parcubacteria bacterium]|jgi:hypothetical protein
MNLNLGSYDDIVCILRNKVADYSLYQTLASFIINQINDKFTDTRKISNFIRPLTGEYHQAICEALQLIS